MKAYHDLLKHILAHGNMRGDRTGTGTISCFGLQFRHDLSESFPLLTTKKVPWKAVVVELLWFLRGGTNIRDLLEQDVHIWTDDAYRMYLRYMKGHGPDFTYVDKKTFEDRILTDFPIGFAKQFGELGPIYGAQWRTWNGTELDQLTIAVNRLRKDPEGRRHIVTAWNPAQVDQMALPPCHCFFQFYVANGKLSCQMYQRSADTFLGVPFNIASYALLTHIIARELDLKVGELIITFGDVHIYKNHLPAVYELLQRDPLTPPQLQMFQPRESFNEYLSSDFQLKDYFSHPPIKAELSVGT